MTQPADQVARTLAPRRGDNEPVEFKPAAWDGHRSVRLALSQSDVGLATATYSYNLTHEERTRVARRIAALWNLAAASQWSTEAIEAMTNGADNGSV
ncbi:hypothetical protein [Phenylobacterium sp. 58.2.17]|uniref:hypothetical protein n=1 Tax=Phenylobacterium sp. 58.2.17 TaxID=2969306 RepID=UPI002263C31A|nr:hypothetical protein [Phenylobacterium sp. 58.2.17]MCX7585064.1 hypothetical protein [Phenylobacterium sp. 58.2.17]